MILLGKNLGLIISAGYIQERVLFASLWYLNIVFLLTITKVNIFKLLLLNFFWRSMFWHPVYCLKNFLFNVIMTNAGNHMIVSSPWQGTKKGTTLGFNFKSVPFCGDKGTRKNRFPCVMKALIVNLVMPILQVGFW